MNSNGESGKYRRKAENLVKKRLVGKRLIISEADSIKLNHELQVHQIELELINEELQKAKELSETTAEKYSELYYAPMGYFTLSHKNEIIDVNPTGSLMLGMERQYLLKRSFSLFVSDESKTIFDLFINRIFRTQTIQTCDLTLKIAGKPPVFIYLNGLKSGGSAQCHLIAIDITDRKKTEKEYQRLHAELISAQAKLSVALESGNIGIWEWDLGTGEIIMDEHAEILFGKRSGLLGRTIVAFEDLVQDEDIPVLKNAFNKAIERNLSVDTIIRARDNVLRTKYLSIKAHIRKNDAGKPVRFTGVCFDVSGLKETEQTILKLNEELIRSNKDLENFAYVASHDLQEPLRMVSSYMQLLSMKYEDRLDEDAREYIGFAVEGAKRMYELLNGLLTYSRITRGAEFSDIDMNTVLGSVTKNLRLIIRERGAVINADLLPVVYADGNQMMQLLQNLIANAIKFSENSPRVFITSRTEDHDHIITVRDEGMGIEPQYFEKIFNIFQRLVPRNDIPGVGIGLSICKRIVERHKGRIWVESEPGKGSSFFFSIPF